MTHYYLNQAQVAERIGVAPRRVRGWQARGLLPRPSVVIGLGRSGVPGWSKTVIDRWNNKRLEGGDGSAPTPTR
ncbi:helix-turn-helix transcriptional regulator [Varibaculum cambriense]|uniref:helix-turn-helix transcriptional regulator n=1 Tax=Varibaculum cambriense TaxID=184870 RepID=UPI000C8061CE|nr:transcriptional regulator [Varibaculum cambriense]MBS5944951.1 transcriptional regulator [Varibaculum cambriense]